MIAIPRPGMKTVLVISLERVDADWIATLMAAWKLGLLDGYEVQYILPREVAGK